jgi:tetratricopeptide (TPR) repeat protein
MNEKTHHPVHPQDLLRRLVGEGSRSPLDALGEIALPATEVEDFRPVSECLEWRLADAYWDRWGIIPFVRNDVPYLVNNNGRLSENAAALVLTALDEARDLLPPRLLFLEFGAGTGLFARYFLDAFAELCREHGRDDYHRLTYAVSDRFERAVAGWRRDGLFAGHEDHVCLCLGEGTRPSELKPLDGERPLPEVPPTAVFCNYVLDVLPPAIVRRGSAGLEQLHVRAHLAQAEVALRTAGLASIDEARALAASGSPADLLRLLPLLPRIEIETAFRPWTDATAAEVALLAALPEGGRAIINRGALACFEELTGWLAPSGLILVNDYGPVRSEDTTSPIGVQRFGGSVALGLNFPMLEAALAGKGFEFVAPAGDEQRQVHTRLAARRIGSRTRELLDQRFGMEPERQRDAPQEEARSHVAAGRRHEALAAYRRVIERNPNDWYVLGEAAEYIGLQLGDHAAGIDLARAALARNPWTSAWLWNILGDCFFCRNRLADAHEAFLQAQRIDPDDPRTNLNLAFTLSACEDHTGALAAIARGLANDGRGQFRPRLIEKQAQILSLIAEQAAAEQARLARRVERFQ